MFYFCFFFKLHRLLCEPEDWLVATIETVLLFLEPTHFLGFMCLVKESFKTNGFSGTIVFRLAPKTYLKVNILALAWPRPFLCEREACLLRKNFLLQGDRPLLPFSVPPRGHSL